MICTGYNEQIISLLMRQQILWKCILDDDTEIWADFDMPDLKDPWTRARQFCNNNNKNIIEVKVIVPGNPEQTVFKDLNGLNNIIIVRGMAKDINDSSETVFSFMTFGQLKEDGMIYTRRFYWPECSFGTYEEVRAMTPENEALLYKKRIKCKEDCTCQSNEQI